MKTIGVTRRAFLFLFGWHYSTINRCGAYFYSERLTAQLSSTVASCVCVVSFMISCFDMYVLFFLIHVLTLFVQSADVVLKLYRSSTYMHTVQW